MCRNARSATQAYAPPSSSAAHRQVSKSKGQVPSSASSNQARSFTRSFRIPHCSFWGLGVSDAFLRVRSAGGRLLGNGRDFHSGLQQLQTRRDNFLAVFKPAFYNTFAFEKAAGLKITAFDSIIGFHHKGVFQSLLRADHFVRD